MKTLVTLITTTDDTPPVVLTAPVADDYTLDKEKAFALYQTWCSGDNDYTPEFDDEFGLVNAGNSSANVVDLDSGISFSLAIIDAVLVVPIAVSVEVEYLLPAHHSILIPAIPAFNTLQDAFEWMDAEVDDPHTDNYRSAFCDDDDAMQDYTTQQEKGCCGSFDEQVTIGGRLGFIGCNYGH